MIKPRPTQPTVKCVDTYCELYKDLFVEVKAYEYFKYLHVGLISELKRKSLPAIASSVGIENEQGLLHFLTESPWKAEDLETRRLEIILNNLQLILQPFVQFNLILKWLKVFPIPRLSLGFSMLIAKMNEVDCLRYLVYFWDDFYYSSA